LLLLLLSLFHCFDLVGWVSKKGVRPMETCPHRFSSRTSGGRKEPVEEETEGEPADLGCLPEKWLLTWM